MATTRDILNRALRKINVVGQGQTVDGAEIAEALDALNMMLPAWRLRGVDVFHSDLTVAEDFPMDDEYHEGVVYLLASRMSPDYEIPQSFDADDWFRAIQAAYLTIDEVSFDTGLTQMPSREWTA